MQAEFVTPQTQERFFALLRYYAHGDFARFCRAADLAYGLERTMDKYFSASLLLATQIAGVCESTSASGRTEWWASHTGDVPINSRRRKIVGASESWFRSHQASTVPLVVNADGKPLILGALEAASVPGCFFDRSIDHILPAFRSIEKDLFRPGTFADEKGRADAQVFRPEAGLWEPTNSSQIVGPCLVRSRDQYSGWSLYVFNESLGLKLRITEPEWAFVVAFHLLPWSLDALFQVRDRSIEMHRAVKLPALALRSLFASASSVCIGRTVIFSDVDESTIAGLKAYFAPVRSQQ
jgi:hypothetical protein